MPQGLMVQYYKNNTFADNAQMAKSVRGAEKHLVFCPELKIY